VSNVESRVNKLKGPESAAEPSNVVDIEATKEIFTQLRKINEALPGAHQSLLSIVENAGANPPKPRTYATYLEIMEMVKSGVTVYSTSKRLKIPYSTCHAYTKMTPAQVSKLKAAEKVQAAKEALPVGQPSRSVSKSHPKPKSGPQKAGPKKAK
jgi:hypothetical protein